MVLQRSIFAAQAQLSEGRYQVLRLGTGGEGEEVPEGAGAEVDTPSFRFDRKECRLVGQRKWWEKGAKWQGRVDEVLASYITSLREEWSRRGRQRNGGQAVGSSLRGATGDTTPPQTKVLLMLRLC